MKIRDVIRLVEADGWRQITQIGSHRHYKHPSNCAAAAETRTEVESLIREAIEGHLEAMRADGDPFPEPSEFDLVEVGP